ncbi:hypothetical protein DFJ74DRAFT_722264 [Hyaloraphidium curvatum]|nr:hypothetical protein DFJ74DRAFT_722264 [Hyaloraphidium curvatum]
MASLPPPPRKRVPRGTACQPCSASRRKCDGGDPCARCAQRGQPCRNIPEPRAADGQPGLFPGAGASNGDFGYYGSDGSPPGAPPGVARPPSGVPLSSGQLPPQLPGPLPGQVPWQLPGDGFPGPSNGTFGLYGQEQPPNVARAPSGGSPQPAFGGTPPARLPSGPLDPQFSGAAVPGLPDHPASLPPLHSLPPDYAAALYPSVPPGLLPPPPVLQRSLDAALSVGVLGILHRATLDSRVAAGEDPSRASYRARFQARQLALLRGPTRAAGRMRPELRPAAAAEHHMDALLLASLAWAGASLGTRMADEGRPEAHTGMGKEETDALEAWVADELAELAAWFVAADPAAGSSGGGALGMLWREMLEGDEYGGEPQALLMTGYHRDMFDALTALFTFLWGLSALGRSADHAALAGALSARVAAMARMAEWCARGPDDERDLPAAWIRAEEKLRLVAGLTAAAIVVAELRSSPSGPSPAPLPSPGTPGVAVATPPERPTATAFDPRTIAAVEIPCHDALFEALPSALAPGAVHAYPRILRSFAGYPRRRITHGAVHGWIDLPPGSPQREAVLRGSFGRVWELGRWAFLSLVGALMARHAALRAWLHARGLEAHELDPPCGRAAELAVAAPEVLAEALARRAAFLSALADAERHLPPQLAAALDAGDGAAVRALGSAHYGPYGWPRLAAYLVWLHALHVLVRSPGDFAAVLADDPGGEAAGWLRGPGFVECAAHAVAVSRLAAAVLADPVAAPLIPQLIPVAVLRAGAVHAAVLRRLASGPEPAGLDGEVVRRLVEDTAACLGALRLGGQAWAYTRQAHRVFERIVLEGGVPTEEELDALREGKAMR